MKRWRRVAYSASAGPEPKGELLVLQARREGGFDVQVEQRNPTDRRAGASTGTTGRQQPGPPTASSSCWPGGGAARIGRCGGCGEVQGLSVSD